MRMVTFAGAALALSLGSAAFAGPQNINHTCTSNSSDGRATSCGGTEDYRFQSESADLIYGIVLKAPAEHCAAVTYYVQSYDGATTYGQTGVLQAGQQDWIKIPSMAPGLQIVKVGATGVVGGCVGSTMSSWGASVEAQIVPQ